jgi:hypothetical protein
MFPLKFSAPGFQPLAHLRNDLFGRNANTRLLEPRPGRFRTARKLSLHTPVVHRLAHGGFQEVGQRFAFAQHGFEVGSQLRLNTHLRKDGGFHLASVLRMCCIVKPLRRTAGSCRWVRSIPQLALDARIAPSAARELTPVVRMLRRGALERLEAGSWIGAVTRREELDGGRVAELPQALGQPAGLVHLAPFSQVLGPGLHQARVQQVVRSAAEGQVAPRQHFRTGGRGVIGMVAEQQAALARGDAGVERRGVGRRV